MDVLYFMVVLLLSGEIVSEHNLKPAIAHWAVTSGFAALDNSIETVNLVGIIVSSLLLFPTIYISFSNNIYISLLIVNISSIFALVQLYYGFNMYLYTHTTINQLLPGWTKILNSQQLDYIELRFWCCGFQFRHQFFGDNCTYSPLPCAPQLFNALSSPIKATGLTLLCHSAVNLIIAITIFFLSKKENEIQAEAENFRKLSDQQKPEKEPESLLPGANDQIPIDDNEDQILEDSLKDIPMEDIEVSGTISNDIETCEKKPLREKL